MKKVIIILSVIIVGIIAFYLIYSWQRKQEIYSDEFLKKFENLSAKEETSFFNSLNGKNRMKFIVAFMKNRTFASPPEEYLKFYSDGDFISDYVEDYTGEENREEHGFYVGKWIFKDGVIIIDSPNRYNNIFGKYVVLDSVRMEAIEDETAFYFHVLKGYDHEGKNLANEELEIRDGVLYEKKNNGVAVSEAISKYNKLKKLANKK